MKATVISNGTVKIILESENDMEKAALKHISKLEICATELDQVASVISDKIPEGSVIIGTRTSSKNTPESYGNQSN